MNREKSHSDYQDPKGVLQKAIDELNVFTRPETSRIIMGKNGRLFASKGTRLERMVNLARSYIAPLFSDHIKQEQENNLKEIKEVVLWARDTIKIHSDLIVEFKDGNDAQRSLAASALLTIQEYNKLVSDSSEDNDNDEMHNFERHRLLLDQEIKGQQIELPDTISVKYDSHPEPHPAQKMLKELSQTFLLKASKKSNLTITSTHKKNDQFVIDTFFMKVNRMIQTHLTGENVLGDILPLVRKGNLEIDRESNPDLIIMRLLIEIGPGTYILVSGSFKKNHTDSQFMAMPMPILDSFRLSFQLTHSGFPYPSQYTGWSLEDRFVKVSPLRTDQVPFYQQTNQRKKRILNQLLYDSACIQKTRQRAKLKREIFDQSRDLFIPLHRQLQQVLLQNHGTEKKEIFDAFFAEVDRAPSPFDFIVKTQQLQLDLMVKLPIKSLEEEWLNTESTPLRMGSSQERFQTACQRLEHYRKKGLDQLDPSNTQHAYILQQGLWLGDAFQEIGLQYQSEKMGFSPPLLNDFARKLQLCAFEQLLTFMNQCEHQLDMTDRNEIKKELIATLNRDIQLFEAPTAEESGSSAIAIIDELEVYFNSRFYSLRR